MSPQKLAEFIGRCDLAVVSSLSPEDAPQSAVTPDLEIIFDTVDSSRKYRNLKVRGECSITMWSGEVTLQYEGIAEEAAGSHIDQYFKRFPDGRDRLNWPGITYFVVRPKWVRYSDFKARPRLIEEFSF